MPARRCPRATTRQLRASSRLRHGCGAADLDRGSLLVDELPDDIGITKPGALCLLPQPITLLRIEERRDADERRRGWHAAAASSRPPPARVRRRVPGLWLRLFVGTS